jgi:diaminopimelate decarboxylase
MTIEIAGFAPIVGFRADDGQLILGGKPVEEFVARVGKTPFYAYDRAAIDARIALLRQHLPATVRLHYAMKANPLPKLVRHMVTQVHGLDVASAGELRVAMGTGISPHDVSFAGPGKTDEELEAAVRAGVLINLESPREVRVLAERARRGEQARVAIRVNPDFELKSAGMRMGGGPKQFGIDAEAVPAVLREIGDAGLGFEGFHLYWGSQNLNAESICEAQRKSYELALALSRHAPSPVTSLNLGGGFGIPYFPGERALDLAPIGANLGEIALRAARDLPEARLKIELGRYLVGEAGVYVCRVLDRKVSRGQVFLVTDGGLHHHLAATGNFGQVLRKNYPVAIANRLGGEAREVASVVGPLCTPLDLLAERASLDRAEEGDLVAVFRSGAYGYTASPRDFLGHPHPAEHWLG